MVHQIDYCSPGRKPLIKLGVGIPGGRFVQRKPVLVATNFEITTLNAQIARDTGIRLTRDRPSGTRATQNYHGVDYDLYFAVVPLQLRDNAGYSIEWDATVAFWDAPTSIEYLGLAEAIEYLDPKIVVPALEVHVEPNGSFPGRIRPRPPS